MLKRLQLPGGAVTALPLRTAAPVSVVSGLCLWLAFPDHNIWPLAPVGVALLAVAARGQRARTGALLGLISGLAYFGPTLHWSGVYVGNLPWIALTVLQALYIALLGLALPAAWRTRAAPVVIAGLWVAQEALRDRTPYGGFPWARLAFSQTSAPTVHLAALGGAPLVTFATALAGGLLAAGDRERAPAGGVGAVAVGRRGRRRRRAGCSCRCRPAGRPIQVAGVQGDVPTAGLDFDAQRAAVLDLHAKGAENLAAQVAAGTRVQPDVVIWPENSSDLDPFQEADARATIQAAVDGDQGADPRRRRAGQPAGQAEQRQHRLEPGHRPGARCTSSGTRCRSVSTSRTGPSSGTSAARSTWCRGTSSPGTRSACCRSDRPRPGVAICFEVAYDDLVRDNVEHGADLLVVQTNNATFGYTDEAAQQLAMSRLRAVEHGRAVAQISTVGVSALIAPDGRIIQQTKLFTPALLQAALPLRTEITVADQLGELAGDRPGRDRAGGRGGRRAGRAPAPG